MKTISQLSRLKKDVQDFHRDERGIETIQAVMILAVGGLVVILIFTFFDQIKAWASGVINTIIGRKQ